MFAAVSIHNILDLSVAYLFFFYLFCLFLRLYEGSWQDGRTFLALLLLLLLVLFWTLMAFLFTTTQLLPSILLLLFILAATRISTGLLSMLLPSLISCCILFLSLFRPKIFHSRTGSYLIVVDPASRAVYKIMCSFDDLSSNLLYLGKHFVDEVERFVNLLLLAQNYFLDGHIAGSTFNSTSSLLYIGIRNHGSFPGSIVVIDTDTMAYSTSYVLQTYIYTISSIFPLTFCD